MCMQLIFRAKADDLIFSSKVPLTKNPLQKQLLAGSQYSAYALTSVYI